MSPVKYFGIVTLTVCADTVLAKRYWFDLPLNSFPYESVILIVPDILYMPASLFAGIYIPLHEAFKAFLSPKVICTLHPALS